MTVIAALLLAAVLVAAVIRPHGVPEAVVAVPAAMLAVVLGLLPLDRAVAEVCAVIAVNDSRPWGRARPLAARHRPGSGGPSTRQRQAVPPVPGRVAPAPVRDGAGRRSRRRAARPDRPGPARLLWPSTMTGCCTHGGSPASSSATRIRVSIGDSARRSTSASTPSSLRLPREPRCLLRRARRSVGPEGYLWARASTATTPSTRPSHREVERRARGRGGRSPRRPCRPRRVRGGHDAPRGREPGCGTPTPSPPRGTQRAGRRLQQLGGRVSGQDPAPFHHQ